MMTMNHANEAETHKVVYRIVVYETNVKTEQLHQCKFFAGLDSRDEKGAVVGATILGLQVN